MLTLFGNLDSGNVHKVQMLLHWRGIAFRRVDVDQPRGEPKRPEYLALNPIGKVPAMLLEDGSVLSESGALLYHFARDTALWPDDERQRAEVLRWMFFEQYSHETALAVLRYLVCFANDPLMLEARRDDLEARCAAALSAMERPLGERDFVAGPAISIADLALYPYTRLAGEAKISLEPWPAVRGWLARIEGMDRFLPVYADAAAEVISFEAYFQG